MSVYKEGYHIVALIEGASKQVFPDAADYGCLTRHGDSMWNAAKQLAETYGKERKVEKYATGVTVRQTISLIDEHGSRQEEKYELVYTTISKSNAKHLSTRDRMRKPQGYLSIHKLD